MRFHNAVMDEARCADILVQLREEIDAMRDDVEALDEDKKVLNSELSFHKDEQAASPKVLKDIDTQIAEEEAREAALNDEIAAMQAEKTAAAAKAMDTEDDRQKWREISDSVENSFYQREEDE